ncbi:hypothetical protein [Thermoanaerobacterium thermosaccharolyticum]|nr:hypothetical protein [Thermoanaerobacterium thermosaccharolyticum]
MILDITNVATEFNWIADKNLLATLSLFGNTIDKAWRSVQQFDG